jgi:hypothetical protein
VTRGRPAGMLGAMFARALFGSCCLALTALSGACGSGTETGNPSLTGSLSYTGLSSAPGRYGVREGGSVATITNAWLALDAVQITPSGDCGIDGGQAFTVPALGVGDHAAGNHNFTPYAAEAGRFCRVRLPFALAPATTDPDELGGASLLIVGSLADGTPFSIESSSELLVELHADTADGFALASGAADTLLVFDFATWLQGVDFAAAERSEDAIVISSTSNPELLLSFEQSLAAGVALYRDRDADGQIDPEPGRLAHFE